MDEHAVHTKLLDFRTLRTLQFRWTFLSSSQSSSSFLLPHCSLPVAPERAPSVCLERRRVAALARPAICSRSMSECRRRWAPRRRRWARRRRGRIQGRIRGRWGAERSEVWGFFCSPARSLRYPHTSHGYVDGMAFGKKIFLYKQDRPLIVWAWCWTPRGVSSHSDGHRFPVGLRGGQRPNQGVLNLRHEESDLDIDLDVLHVDGDIFQKLR